MSTSAATPQPGRLPGRKAEAAVNDAGIVTAAFDVLTLDPKASMADIAGRAGVGVASLYRRYPTRQALVHQLCLSAMTAIGARATACAALLRDPAEDPWAAFVDFLSSALAAGAGAMRALAGTFDANAELARAAAQMNASMQDVVLLAQRRGAVRDDVVAADITQLFEMLRAVRVGNQARSDQLRQRYLALFVTALRPSAATVELAVGAPSWPEISGSWNSVAELDPPAPARAVGETSAGPDRA